MEEQSEAREMIQDTFSLYTRAAEEVVAKASKHVPPEFVAKVKTAQLQQ